MNKLISLTLLALSFTTLNVEAQLKGQYPPVDKAPPPVAEWTALVDQSKIPKAPVKTPTTQCAATDEFCTWTCTTCTRPESDVVSCPKKNEWALTYDDGPTQFSLRVLENLNSRNIKGTFFSIGSRVFENPQILKQIVDSGHQIGVHTWSHTPLTTQTNEQIIAEVKWTEMAIKEAVNLTPKWFRPPQGDFDDRVRGVLTQLGYKIAIWDRDTFDWMSNSNPTYDLAWITGNFTEWVKNTTSPTGFVSLEHDAFDKSSSMTGKAMDIVLNAKFSPQSLSVCLGDNQPYVEATKLPRSGNGNDTNNNSAKQPEAQPGQPQATPSGTNSIGMNVLLSTIMMILGFVGSIYI